MIAPRPGRRQLPFVKRERVGAIEMKKSVFTAQPTEEFAMVLRRAWACLVRLVKTIET
jgi:hypothetical protein